VTDEEWETLKNIAQVSGYYVAADEWSAQYGTHAMLYMNDRHKGRLDKDRSLQHELKYLQERADGLF